MDKAEAMKILKDFHDNEALFSVRTALETLHPELAESEDERIRKALIEYFSTSDNTAYYVVCGVATKKILAWLEKQKPSEEALQYVKENHSSSETSDFQAAMNIAVAKAYDKGYNDGLEKQSNKKKDFHKRYKKVAKSDWFKKSHEGMSCGMITDENECKPKFGVGDWVVNNEDGSVGKITMIINNDGFVYDHTNGFFHSCFEDKYHLWTIADAKGGDVLANNISVFIYAEILYNMPYAYCGVDKFGVFKDNCKKNNWSNNLDDIHPATKEQRDLLFRKMKEAGYEWNPDKKELKKIEQKN